MSVEKRYLLSPKPQRGGMFMDFVNFGWHLFIGNVIIILKENCTMWEQNDEQTTKGICYLFT